MSHLGAELIAAWIRPLAFMAIAAGCRPTALPGPVKTPPAERPSEVTSTRVDTHKGDSRPQMNIDSDAPLPQTAQAELIAKLRAAFVFALDLNGWSHPDQIAADPVEIRFKTLNPGTGASTSGPDRISVSSNALEQTNNGVYAHELTHLQDFRAARKGMLLIPRYLEEGRGYFVGREWRRLRNETVDDSDRAAVLAEATAVDVEFVLAKFRHQPEIKEVGRAKKGALARTIGVFFIDYLRLRAGFPDAMPRLSRVWERLGSGATFDDAFSAEFNGLALSTLEANLVEFIRLTEGRPSKRLEGTPYEQP